MLMCQKLCRKLKKKKRDDCGSKRNSSDYNSIRLNQEKQHVVSDEVIVVMKSL